MIAPYIAIHAWLNTRFRKVPDGEIHIVNLPFNECWAIALGEIDFRRDWWFTYEEVFSKYEA